MTAATASPRVQDWDQLTNFYPGYLEGDPAETRALFTGLTRALEGYFRARMGRASGGPSDADDLVQATLLKIHFARERFDSAQSLKTWVFTIASRALIDHWRGERATESLDESTGEEGDLPLDRLPSEWLSPEEKTRLHRDLNQALETLKPIERSIVYLYGVEGLSMAEIAETLGLTEGSAKLRAHRAYRELRKLLGFAGLTLGLELLRNWTNWT